MIEIYRIKIPKTKTVFAIQLDNSKEKFAVDRGFSTCYVLNSEIKTGDTIKIYYRSSYNDYNTHVFQIEKNNSVLINSRDYSKMELGMMILALLFWILINYRVHYMDC